MAGKQRTTFDKLQKERNRMAKQAAKREKRLSGGSAAGSPVYDDRGMLLGTIGEDGELVAYVRPTDEVIDI